MPRGANQGTTEHDRVMSREDAPERATARGTGVKPHEKQGYGRSSMQKNSDSRRKTPM